MPATDDVAVVHGGDMMVDRSDNDDDIRVVVEVVIVIVNGVNELWLGILNTV